MGRGKVNADSDFKALFVVFFAYQKLPQDYLHTNDQNYPDQRLA